MNEPDEINNDALYLAYQQLVEARKTATTKLKTLGFDDDEIAAIIGA